ncbi:MULTISPECIES: DJ-1/PfpI family protein [Myroides]|uniref:DJ-1/PfpI family protein n=1 Tax=Myroides TaxID=76831 RepID=UPI001302FC0C|nr:DJ-1/PfpI family protein [Myroides phaeus]
MERKNIYIYLFDGYSDWEVSYIMPEIRKNAHYRLITVSDKGRAVMSSGGLRVLPDVSVEEINLANATMFILPGGKLWETQLPTDIRIDAVINYALAQGMMIAGICGATAYLGKKGVLDNRFHTSNDVSYLKALAPAYTGDKLYLNSLAASDDLIITASGIGAVEFTREIMLQLLFEKQYIEQWFELFKNGNLVA